MNTQNTPAPTDEMERVTPSAPPSLDSLDLDGLGEKEQSSHPVFPDANGQAAVIAVRIRQREEEKAALEGALQTDKQELKMIVAPFLYKANHGKAEPETTVDIVIPGAKPVQVCFQNRYSLFEKDAQPGLLAAFGKVLAPDQVREFLKPTFTIKVESEKLPRDTAVQFISDLKVLARKYNCAGAFSYKQGVKPTKEFHIRRFTVLTPEQNVALDQTCACVAMVKTKGARDK